MIAVMGAAGNVGSRVADRLLREERQVRVLEHRRKLDGLAARGAEVVSGDAGSPGDLRALFDGADTALVLLPEDLADPDFTANRSRMGAAIADALAGSGAEQVVVLSTVGAGLADAFGPPAGLRELEQRLSRLEGTGVLVLRSGFYMENLLAALPLIQAKGVNASAVDGDLELPMIATRDVAAEAAERLASRDFSGHRVKLLVGPEDVGLRAATRALGERLGLPDVAYVQLPPADVQGALMGFGMSEAGASAMVELQLGLNRHGSFAAVRDAADATTPTRLADFLEEATR
jgi:uncharacterized protein YbjT (DUF2867 family)